MKAFSSCLPRWGAVDVATKFWGTFLMQKIWILTCTALMPHNGYGFAYVVLTCFPDP